MLGFRLNIDDSELSKDQLESIYDVVGYRKMLLSIASKDSDLAIVKGFIEACENARALDMNADDLSGMECVLFFAYAWLVESLKDLNSLECIDTRDPRFWLKLANMCRLCGLLTLVPVVKLSDDDFPDAKDLAWLVAFWLDIAGRLASGYKDSVIISDLDEKTAKKRCMSIWRDLICGRSFAWIEFCRDNGRVAVASSGVEGVSFDTLEQDELFIAKSILAELMMSYFGDDFETELVNACANLVLLADETQFNYYQLVFGNEDVHFNEDVIRKAVHVDLIQKFGNVLVSHAPYPGTRGYLKLFGYDIVDGVLLLDLEARVNLLLFMEESFK